jgi:transposase-like protein
MRHDTDAAARAALATRLGLTEKQTRKWFYNKSYKSRRQDLTGAAAVPAAPGSAGGGSADGSSSSESDDDAPGAAPAAARGGVLNSRGVLRSTGYSAAVVAELEAALAAGMRHTSDFPERAALAAKCGLSAKQVYDWLISRRERYLASRPKVPAKRKAAASDDDGSDGDAAPSGADGDDAAAAAAAPRALHVISSVHSRGAACRLGGRIPP